MGILSLPFSARIDGLLRRHWLEGVHVFVTGWPVTRTRQLMGPPVTWTPMWWVSLWPI